MPALSTSTISASDSASKLAAKPGVRGADKSTDGSPFAALLEATSQQNGPRKPQPVATPAANNNDTPAAKNTEPQTQIAQAAPRTHDDNIVSKDSGKRDKKADSGTDPDDDTAAAAPQPQPQPQPAVQTAAVQVNIQAVVQAGVPVAVPPDAQVNPQAPGPSGTGSSLDAIGAASSSAAAGSGALAAQTGNANNATGDRPVSAALADPQSASQPAPVPVPVSLNGPNGPAAQSPAPTQQIAATDDDDVAATDASPSVSAVTKPAAQNKAGDSKAADKAATIKSASKSPVDPQSLSQPTADDDAEPAAQTTAAAPPVGAAPIAPNGSAGAVTAAQLAAAAPPAQAAKSGTKDSGPANKPAQIAADSNAPAPKIGTASPATPATAVAGKTDANGTDSSQIASSDNSDSKPAHVSASDATAQQPAAPAPIPQAAPTPVLPQGMATAAFGAAAPATGTGGGTVATSVHVAAADADPTLTLGALAVSVAARSLSGARQFDIRLDPPELGRVDVRLSIDASGKTEAHMTADQPQTLSLLQKDAPTLTQALRDAGLDVSQSGLNFSLRGQDRQNGSADAGQGRRTNLTATRAIQAAQSPTAISFNGAAADARVDIHV